VATSGIADTRCHKRTRYEKCSSNPDLSNDVRAFLVWVLDSFPDLDIHLLAMARRREPTEEGHQALTKAMRDLL
jgi:hypothetical protein